MQLILILLPVVASFFCAFAHGWTNKHKHRSSQVRPHHQQAATTTSATSATSYRKGYYYCLSRMTMTMDPNNNQDDTFDLKKLMSACIYLARRGGDIIKEEHNKGQISLKAHNKKLDGDTRTVTEMEANEVLTVADGRAQDAIITSLRSLFGPTLRIVGEEGEVPGEELPTKWSDIINDEDREQQLQSLLRPFNTVPLQLQESLTAKDVCLWIDPLDGTKEFVLGNLTNVSVLIGIAVCDRPVAGVILQPFVGGGDVTYGAIGVGVFHDGDKIEADLSHVVDDNGNGNGNDSRSYSDTTIKIAMSGKHIGDGGRLSDAIDRLNDVDVAPDNKSNNNNNNSKSCVQVLPLNACGNKMLRVIRGDASAHLQGPGASRWDTCAGEALLMALGGVVTSLDGLPYQYIQDSCYDNADGFVAARTPKLHSKLVQVLMRPGNK